MFFLLGCEYVILKKLQEKSNKNTAFPGRAEFPRVHNELFLFLRILNQYLELINRKQVRSPGIAGSSRRMMGRFYLGDPRRL